MRKDSSSAGLTKLVWNKTTVVFCCLRCSSSSSRRGQVQCIQTQVFPAEKTTPEDPQKKKKKKRAPAASCCMIFVAAASLLLLFSSNFVTAAASGHRKVVSSSNHTFRSPTSTSTREEAINAFLNKINKPSVKTIQSPDGDIIDCVVSHHQPAFDHPELKGQRPLDPPERPKGHDHHNSTAADDEIIRSFQVWTLSGESCPHGTVPIRRTTEKDILRSSSSSSSSGINSSIQRFGRRRRSRNVRRDSTGTGHEHAVVFVNGEEFYGAKANLNVWTPAVRDEYEFSLSQIWVISGSFGNDLNTIEAGWQVSPELYGDNYPRFFTYWTSDAYQATGCYNLLCSGFVQTNNRIAIGAAISPRSTYNGRQFDIGLMIWKDPKHGHWWLEFGSAGVLVGYWPAILFSHLRSHANMVQFGGEIVNARSSSGFHTGTQMGSGHFAEEGFGKAAYFRNLQTVDWDNNLLPLTNLHLLADHSNCYDIRQGSNSVWGTYFYYGGPGRNVRCP